MKVQFYSIPDNKVVEMEWENTLAGVPLGLIPYPFAPDSGKSRSGRALPANVEIYWDVECNRHVFRAIRL